MLYELVSEAEYESLPEDPELKFVALEQICRRNMNSMINQDTSTDYDKFVRLQYMSLIATAAEDLGVAGISSSDIDTEGDFPSTTAFMIKANSVALKIRLGSTISSRAFTVQLAQGSRGKIQQQIEKLKYIISDSDLPEEKRVRLLRRLDELTLELSQPRVSYAKVMAVLMTISCGVVVQGTQFLADAPHAIATIHRILGNDKESEDEAIKRLTPPPTKRKALPAPRGPAPHKAFRLPSKETIDDDIPF